MASLSSMPFDIIFLILNHLPDYDTVMRLALTCRSFNAIFEETKTKLVTILYHDAEKYKEESFFIASNYKSLRDVPLGISELTPKINYYNGNIRKKGRSRELKVTGPKEVQAKMAANHSFMLDLYKHLAQTFKYPKKRVDEAKEGLEREELKQRCLNGSPTTISEKKRIIQGLYRFWMIGLLYSAELKVPHDLGISKPSYIDPFYFINQFREDPGLISNYIAPGCVITGPKYFYEFEFMEIFITWDFWDLQVIKVVMGWVEETLEPVSTFLKQEVQSNTKKEKETYLLEYYIKGGFLAFIADDFPRRVLPLIQTSTDPTQLRDTLKATLSDPTLYRPRDLPSHSGGFLECFNIFVTLHEASLTYGRRGRRYRQVGRYIIPPRRVCIRPASPRFYTEEHNCDFLSCVWDEWRLEEWGYQLPADEISPADGTRKEPSEQDSTCKEPSEQDSTHKEPPEQDGTRKALVDKLAHGVDAARLAFRKCRLGLKR
ncbi:hypothetical protein ABW20_dc0108816 [Dactylellina cionopaga]|nr:hypothetical protein ABW20_dc0108816 [Dactylellina cionopaga]